MGTPIRLVRNDGGIIELMATTMTMNVDRGVTPLPMPFAGGSRFAFDLNLPKSLITIEGVMTDDDFINTGLQREANATIDFSRFHGDSADSAARWDASFTSNGILDGVTNNDISTATHAIKINNTHEVWLAKSSSANQGLDSSITPPRYYISIHNNTTARSAADIAASLTSLVGTYTGTFALTAATINSPTDGTANTAVFLTQVNKGKSGNMSHPSFSPWPTASTSTKPYHLKYSGGRDSSSSANKSAGDKVAELYAVLNNSNNGGGGAIAGGASFSNLLNNPLDDREISGLDKKYGDYIIGIQIPFSSNTNSNESLFYMPTGGLMEITDKTADNAPVTGTKFDAYDSEFTGIKGAVANATFVQLGGEPIYSYTINFAPIDWIF
tara:strand:+ start:1749 stop:2900 length:1152 start_codon:yes stop_codon:yes gene_type:complete